MSNADKSLSVYDAIAKTVQFYIDGAKSGRGGDMQSTLKLGFRNHFGLDWLASLHRKSNDNATPHRSSADFSPFLLIVARACLEAFNLRRNINNAIFCAKVRRRRSATA